MSPLFFPWIWKYFRLLLIIVVWRYFFGSVSHYTRCFVLLPLNRLSLETQDEGQKFPQRCGEKWERGLRRDELLFGEFVVCRSIVVVKKWNRWNLLSNNSRLSGVEEVLSLDWVDMVTAGEQVGWWRRPKENQRNERPNQIIWKTIKQQRSAIN